MPSYKITRKCCKLPSIQLIVTFILMLFYNNAFSFWMWLDFESQHTSSVDLFFEWSPWLFLAEIIIDGMVLCSKLFEQCKGFTEVHFSNEEFKNGCG